MKKGPPRGGPFFIGDADQMRRREARPTRPRPPSSSAQLPGSGTGLLGLQERVTLANGVLVLGPDASGDFVVEADLPW